MKAAPTTRDPLLDHLNLLLERAKQWESQNKSDLLQISASRKPQEQLKALSAIRDLDPSSTLKDLVISDPRFPGSTVLFISQVEGSGGTGFYPALVVIPTIRRLLKTRDAARTLAWLEKVLATRRAEGWKYTLLFNISVDAPVGLTDTVDLVPISEIPEHSITEWIRVLPRAILENPFSSMNPNPSMAVLRERVQIEPFLYSGDAPRTSARNRSTDSEFSDIGLLLTLLGPSPVARVATWGIYSDPDLQEALSGWSRIGHSNEMIPATSDKSIHIRAGDSMFSELVKRYACVEETCKDRINVALSRLNQALRRLGPGDAAVELSIAFEALVGDDQKTEMTNKVKVRSVRMLGGTKSKRTSNATLFNHIYGIRSSLVHSGKISPKRLNFNGQPVSANEIVKLGSSMCADLIMEFISLGKVPDWQMFDIIEHPNGGFRVLPHE